MKTAPYGFLRVAAACPPVRLADPERNADAILASVGRLAAEGAQVLVLPELALTGYSCGDLFFSLETLVRGAERALERVLRETASRPLVVVLGLPVLQGGRLYNAAAVVQAGRLLGVVPKTYLPGYKEYYEERWFSSAREAREGSLRLAGAEVPFGTDLVFQLPEEPGVALAVEICEDLWAPVPPSSRHAVAGATLIVNPSASNDLVSKAEYRRELVRQQSGRTLCAYAYANAGVHESTTDLVFGGHLMIAENGVLLAEGERFRRDGDAILVDVDTERLLVERARQTSFADAVHADARSHRLLPLAPIPAGPGRGLRRPVERHPFVPQDPATLDERCREVFSIQTAGLARRVEDARTRRLVLGLSGGLDSTLALLVCARTLDLLGRPRQDALAVTMPGFGTTPRTLDSARRLAAGWGAELREIDIRAACEQHIRDIGLDPADRESVTYQNLQARERTQVLMDLANKEGGLVVGTGDLSELALGFATFAGDHIAMYNVNASVPKTLVRRLLAWVADHGASEAERAVLQAVLDTPVSPELVPPAGDGAILQRTEDLIGPYELHDFFLYSFVRLGAGPGKILRLARHAFAGAYDEATLRRWLRVFLERFFSQQFKRSVAPDGPKVGSVSLSPRGDWRMPSDATAAAWLRELDEEGAVIRAVLVSASDLSRELADTALFRSNVERVKVLSAPEVRRLADASHVDVVVVDSAIPGAAGVVAALRLDPLTRTTAIVALGRSDFGFSHLDLLEAGANAILPLPPGGDWDDRLMRLIHVPVRRATRFPVDIAIEGGLRGGLRFGGRAINLSVNGILLESRQPLEIGEDVRLAFELPGGHGPIAATATVVRQTPPHHFGVEITSVEADGRVRIKRFVESGPEA